MLQHYYKRYCQDIITLFANVLPVLYLLHTLHNFRFKNFKKQVLPVTCGKCLTVR